MFFSSRVSSIRLNEWRGFGVCLPLGLIEWGRFAMAYTPVEVIYELLTFIGGWTWELGKRLGNIHQKGWELESKS
jgi:hypothetical protein